MKGKALLNKKAFVLLVLLFTLAGVACTSDGGGGGEDDAALDAGSTDPADAAGASEDEEESTEGTTVGSADSVLDAVRERDQVICGVNNEVPGFGAVGEGGELEGFDIDFCKAVAAAALGDGDKVEFRTLSSDQRFPALKSGEIDVLIRNTTWTATRDGAEGATFLHTNFYDGQGMMVPTDSEYQSIDDMEGATVCVTSGTTTEQNLATRFQDIDYTPQVFEDNETLQAAFVEGRCDGWTSDLSQLYGIRSAYPEAEGGPEALRILEDEDGDPEAFSKEPLGPVVRDGDSQWAQIVDWAVYATIQAEEFGITQDNVEEMKETDDVNIQLFLGQESEAAEGTVLDPGLGVDPDFAVNVISAVGNYGEIFNRHLGPDTPLQLERGLNALWTEGGLQYAPPYR